ncbi:MAG: nucleotidyltransferase family protein [Lachnospiraceae bacterium]|nr:nucleotidyltransferase family protein [Lachnospiraceae bacterium]
MGHIGIITEYNPFHNGHAYQINQVKKLFPDKSIIICMSGDYVQRGEPAVFPMSLRTECALSGGADLILELPSIYSSASSELFATAGVLTLAHTGLVDTLCFGAECDNIEALTSLADFFINESENYKALLKDNLSKGQAFPKARANATATCLEDTTILDILHRPNNILAIEYIKAIIKYNLPIKPLVIKRTSDNYDSISLLHEHCSSSALRNILYTNDNISQLNEYMPEAAYNTLKASSLSKPVFFDDYYSFIEYKLLTEGSMLSDYYEMSEELANRINNISILPGSLNELIDMLSGKQITNSRIRRALINIVLGRKKEQISKITKQSPIKYIRILGVKQDSTSLIKEMKSKCELPIINKVAYCNKKLSKDELELFNIDVFENNLYRQVFYNKYGIIIPTDYEQSVIIR